MRFLVLSDVHRREKVIKWANELIEDLDLDGTIVLGDITHFGPPEWAGEFLGALKGRTYAVPGNCDPPVTLVHIERKSISLHLKKVRLGEYVLGGMGGSNPTIFDTPNEMSEEEIMAKLRPVMEEGMILVLHCPPFGVLDVPFSGKHVGSVSIAKLVEEFKPRVVLSGHIHEDRGIVEKDGVVYMNPGPAKEGYSGLLELGDVPSVKLLEQRSE
jgi:Icc-related predicted phosphoesterase